MLDFSTPDFPITFRPDLNLLVGRWLTEISLVEEVKNNYLHLFDAAQQYQCRFWLLDARRRFRTVLEITEWVEEHVPARSMELLGNEIRVAFLLAPNQILTDSPRFPSLRHPSLGHPQSAQFTNEGEAIAWLMAEQVK